MEQNFQTSFIPKKPMVEERAMASAPISLFTIIAIFIFFTIAITIGGLYFYDNVLTKKITKKETDLNLAKNRFEPSKISQLQLLDKRLRASDEVLAEHITVSPIFSALQTMTLKTIGYTKFAYDFDNKDGSKVLVKMSGVAIGYQSVALQADIFSKNKYLIDPIFYNLTLNDTGNVLFDLDFSVDPDFIDYRNVVKTSMENLPDNSVVNSSAPN